MKLQGHEALNEKEKNKGQLWFWCLCVHVSLVEFVTDDQQDTNFSFVNLYPISSTCFGGCFRPSSVTIECIYSFWTTVCEQTIMSADIWDLLQEQVFEFPHFLMSDTHIQV